MELICERQREWFTSETPACISRFHNNTTRTMSSTDLIGLEEAAPAPVEEKVEEELETVALASVFLLLRLEPNPFPLSPRRRRARE